MNEMRTLKEFSQYTINQISSFTLYLKGGWDRVIGIVTRYGLDGPGMESRLGGGGEISHILPDRPWGPPRVLYNGYPVAFQDIFSAKGRGVALTTHPI